MKNIFQSKGMMLNSKITIIFATFLLIFNIFLVSSVDASSNSILWNDQEGAVQNNIGIGNDDPRLIAANLINVVLGFLGILFLVLTIFAGFKWMTAAGNDEQVAGAKKLLTAAVIGLVIILSSYAISAFVLDAVFRASTDGVDNVGF